MTDATVKDFNLHIQGSDFPPPNRERTERRRGTLRRVGFDACGIVIVVAIVAAKTRDCRDQTSTTQIGAAVGFFLPLRYL
jgi:hypothetical protein